jgi:hypothetical protein
MATVSMTLGPVSQSKTISADHLNRFLAALHSMYAGEGQFSDQQVAQKWINDTLNGIKTITHQYEARMASAEAVDAVDEIDLT